MLVKSPESVGDGSFDYTVSVPLLQQLLLSSIPKVASISEAKPNNNSLNHNKIYHTSIPLTKPQASSQPPPPPQIFCLIPSNTSISSPAQTHPQCHPHSPQTPSTKGTALLILHGPNLNLLGTREPSIYGSATLSDINTRCEALALSLGASAVETFQTNHEGQLIDRIHQAAAADDERNESENRDGSTSTRRNKTTIGAIIINPAAFTHQSVAVRDALLGVGLPFVEVHISNVHAREAWRSKSYFSDKAVGVICGLGTFGYEAAVMFCCREVLGFGRGLGAVELEAEVEQEGGKKVVVGKETESSGMRNGKKRKCV